MRTDNPKQSNPSNSNVQKDPEYWVTGDEPMTGPQASYLKTLSKRIDALREKFGLPDRA